MAVSSSAAQTERGIASGHGRLNRFIFVLALLPMVLIATIINHYGVNIPYGDEWPILSLFGKRESHQLTFADSYSARRTCISKTHERSRTLRA